LEEQPKGKSIEIQNIILEEYTGTPNFNGEHPQFMARKVSCSLLSFQRYNAQMSVKKTFNANRAKKGISPVIATVILVAVAVVIAAALAGFSSSLFGSYSSTGSAMTIQQATVYDDGSGHVEVYNSGNTSDKVLSVAIDTFPAVDPVFELGEDGTVAPNTMLPMDPVGLDDDSGNLTAGDIVTMRVTFSSGLILSHSVIVSAAP
jgi:flagellin-like protein